ncbi:MAG: NYN domain-containing protein [Thermoflexales bacterium]|nr:NYN domain-containing protein [Thermoflexales bacterium]MCS7324813.1 NYN domain-containing protein [Thermoflexales bacterium]MCX7938146.1 NYN domain-containing protein [Thermoflexales bacterium]MDW8054711.1 NYN domain-containing protein [Anaerolineae bacterium]MDW8293438.1 NYN domain-containing protein [Anaerolineae bacterium]
MSARNKVGVYVDSSNIAMNGGYGMQYDVLREFACRDGAEAVRLHAYVAYDAERAKEDPAYAEGQQNFHASLRDFGFKVIQKLVKRFTDPNTGEQVTKSNSDLDMAVDMLLHADRLDRIVLVTGDGDFVRVVRALQERGCRVELVAFDNVSSELRREVDLFVSGYLIPNLLPVKTLLRNAPAWGDMGSRVRGVCYYHRQPEGYGFMRFLKRIDNNLWISDTRRPESPYDTAYFHDSYFADPVDPSELPNRDIIFEFDLYKSMRGEGWEARNIKVVTRL